MKISILSLFALALVACGSQNSNSSSQTEALAETSPVTVIPGDPGTASPYEYESLTYPQVLKGWLSNYSTFVEYRVDDEYSALRDVATSRVTSLCPNFGSFARAERLKFWSGLLHAISVPESAMGRTMIYREADLPIDSVTGQQIRSEGLLQLSYVDVKNYKYDGGDISWEFDRKMALADYASGTKAGNPARTLLNAYSNLNLGLFIMNRLIERRPTESVQAALGRYWSTMRTTSSAFSKVKSGLRSYVPECF